MQRHSEGPSVAGELMLSVWRGKQHGPHHVATIRFFPKQKGPSLGDSDLYARLFGLFADDARVILCQIHASLELFLALRRITQTLAAVINNCCGCSRVR